MSDTEVKPEPEATQVQAAAGQNARQVFVAKLPAKVTKKDLEDLFDRYGNIVDINIKKNFAFVVGDLHISSSKKSLKLRRPSLEDTTSHTREPV